MLSCMLRLRYIILELVNFAAMTVSCLSGVQFSDLL